MIYLSFFIPVPSFDFRSFSRKLITANSGRNARKKTIAEIIIGQKAFSSEKSWMNNDTPKTAIEPGPRSNKIYFICADYFGVKITISSCLYCFIPILGVVYKFQLPGCGQTNDQPSVAGILKYQTQVSIFGCICTLYRIFRPAMSD